MFINFFYDLKHKGIPISITAFLTLHRAISKKLIFSLNDFYIASRCTLIKNEKYFDLFDQIFFKFFKGLEKSSQKDFKISEIDKQIIEEWLDSPETFEKNLKKAPSLFNTMTPDEILKYFKKILKKQTDKHHGGSKWIGTGGTSPLGHSGHHPNGMRIGGVSQNKSAIKIAMERRYKDYNTEGLLSQNIIGEALKKLKNLTPIGTRDQLNIDKSIALTIKNGGEISIHFDKKIKDQLKVVLLIDNGGWSMDPHIPIVKSLFKLSNSQFKEVKIYYFHNTIYEKIWKDPQRNYFPIKIKSLVKENEETRFIIVGDASMAPYEIMAKNGSIYTEEKNKLRSIECLEFLSKKFPYSIWLNPIPNNEWKYTQTINIINKIFPMFELSLRGIEDAVNFLNSIKK